MSRKRVDALTVVSIVLLIFMVYSVITDSGIVEPSIASALEKKPSPNTSAVVNKAPISAVQTKSKKTVTAAAVAMSDLPNQEAIAAPYDHFALTQGLHSSAYDQNAIDISAGKGSTIKSPINGIVKQVFTDQFGNTTLVIENSVYRVTMLHGNYSVTAGQQVTLGQRVGQESNHGLTFDAMGQSCQGRDCGYHTHINIYDLRIGAYANPLVLLKIQP